MDRPLSADLRPCPPSPTISDGARHAAIRCAQVAACFALTYGASNHLSSLRDAVGRGVFAWEHAIPFVELSILPYLSIFALFAVSFFVCRDRDELERHCTRLLLALAISVACYLLFPLRFDFPRPEPSGPTGELFRWLWSVDLPFNRAPSLHIGVLVLLWARFVAAVRGWPRVVLHAWMTAIGVSVLTTYQHHVIDVGSGLLVGTACLALPPSWLHRLQRRAS